MAKVQTYGKDQRLMNNQRYKVSFELNGQKRDFTFTSRYAPLYSSTNILRNDFPELFEEISEDTLNFQIWQTSILVDELFAENETTTDGVTYAMKQYTRLKTEYNILRNIMIAKGTDAGVAEKHLGEFKITKEIKTPDIEAILKSLKDDLRRWESSLDFDTTPAGAVRAGATTYPLNARVSF